MAEFQEVIRQFNRMCDTCNNCECGLSNVRSTESCYGKLVSLPVESEKAIMSWAAEHPAPVYPSIAKYLEQFGIIIRRDGSLQADFFKAHEPMDADLAQKLGIEPKEE